MKKSVKILIICLIIIFIGIFAFSGYKLFSTLHTYKVAEKAYDSLSAKYVTQNANGSAGNDTDDIILDDEISPVSIDFASLKAENDDVCAWIYSPDTVINYPVAHTEDNATYLHTLINMTYNPSGTIFIDCLNQPDFVDTNTIIYGHHMNDGSMFASLVDYKNPDYYKAHPVLYINTPKYNYRFEVFAAYTTASTSDTYQISFMDENKYQEYLDTVIAASDIKTDVTVSTSDKIATLSTCTYDYDDARYVVQGKLIAIH